MSIDGNYIRNDLRSEIIEPNPTFFSDTRILNLINLAQNEFVRRTRVLQAYAYTSSVQGQADYPMPSDWLGSEKVFYNKPNGTINSWRPLTPTNLEKLGQESMNFLSVDPNVQGTPSKYYVINKTLYVYALPDHNGTNDIFMFYESMPVALNTLDDLISIDDSLYPGIRAYVLAKLWKQDNEDQKAAVEMAQFEKEVGNGFKWKNKRILDGKWALDIQSFVPLSYNSYNSGAVAGSINPLNQ